MTLRLLALASFEPFIDSFRFEGISLFGGSSDGRMRVDRWRKSSKIARHVSPLGTPHAQVARVAGLERVTKTARMSGGLYALASA